MSETMETVEERYQKLQDDDSEDIIWIRKVCKLLDDLMAEREKLISRVEELEELYYHPYPED